MRRRGFTLIELLVSMAILGILATLGFGNFQSTRIKADDAKKKSDLATVAKSLEAYVNDHRSYPGASGGKILCQPPNQICDWGDPFTDGTTLYAAKLPSGVYIYESAGTSYSLYTYLSNDNDPAITTFTPEVICSGTILCNYKVSSSNLP